MKTAILKAPDQSEREYKRLLAWYVRQITAATRRILIPRLPYLRKEGAIKADGWSEDLAALMLLLLQEIEQYGRVVESRLPALFTLLAKSNDRSLMLAVKAATGIDLPPTLNAPQPLLGVSVYRSEQWLADMQKDWIRQNVGLVKSIGQQYHDQLDVVVRNGVFNGWSTKQLSEEIQSKFGVTQRRADLIATDQILNANARLTQIRAQTIGVESYIWTTAGDARVRDAHVALSGKEFTWSNPPSEGHPGTSYRCRCRAALQFKNL